ncbi:basic leucine zipper 34-like [Alnus glutinosa]|uniref:basic leucine zipper 34-like n=1 Tax=Alnus glutinosa TaxID=3517 RepID=UPI002D7838D1|nr:basic leucine zipper 34-like [Alnus glutinosa]
MEVLNRTSHGSNTSTILLPPSHGNFSSVGNSWINGCHASIQGVTVAEIEAKSEIQTPSADCRDRDSNIDPKRHKRILASRQYSQKYRLKQLQYIMQLETEVKALQDEVAINSLRIEYSSRQNLLMRAENNSINQKLTAFSSEIMFKEEENGAAQYEEMKRERDLLKQLFDAQTKPWES